MCETAVIRRHPLKAEPETYEGGLKVEGRGNGDRRPKLGSVVSGLRTSPLRTPVFCKFHRSGLLNVGRTRPFKAFIQFIRP